MTENSALGVVGIIIAILAMVMAGIALTKPTEIDVSNLEDSINQNRADLVAISLNIANLDASGKSLLSRIQVLENRNPSIDSRSVNSLDDDVNDVEDAVRDCVNDAVNSRSINYIDHNGNNQTLSFDEFDEDDWDNCLEDIY